MFRLKIPFWVATNIAANCPEVSRKISHGVTLKCRWNATAPPRQTHPGGSTLLNVETQLETAFTGLAASTPANATSNMAVRSWTSNVNLNVWCRNMNVSVVCRNFTCQHVIPVTGLKVVPCSELWCSNIGGKHNSVIMCKLFKSFKKGQINPQIGLLNQRWGRKVFLDVCFCFIKERKTEKNF